MRKHLFIIIAMLIGRLCFSQQDDIARFVNVFNKKNYSERIIMFDTLKDELKRNYYPYIKDSLLAIRKKAVMDHKQAVLNRLDKIEGIQDYFEHNYSNAISILVKVINTDPQLTDVDSLRILSCLKNSYLKIRSVSKALEMHHLISQFANRNKNYNPWLFHPKLSTIYYELNLYSEAIKENYEEFARLPVKKDMEYLNFYNNGGVYWSRLGNNDSALFHYSEARKHAENIFRRTGLRRDEFAIGLIDGNIGQVYKAQKKYKQAIPLLKEDIYWSSVNKRLDNAANSFNELADCYISLGNYPLAQRYLDSARVILEKYQDVKPFLANIQLYGALYEKSGKPAEAIQYYKRYIKMNDSIEVSQKYSELISQQVAMQVDEKEAIIRQKQTIIDRETENQKYQAMVRKVLFAGLLFLLAVLVVLFVLYKRSYRQQQLLEVKNEEIQEQNTKIEKSLQEKDFLVREVHHRVKNNLQIVSSLLNLQMGMTGNDETKEALAEAYRRIGSISLVHQLLYRNKELMNISVKEYFENLLTQLEQSYSSENKDITLQRRIDDEHLDLDRAIPLGLIINEVVSNAYKHAFPYNKGLITVSFRKLAAQYELKIEDNGVGFDKPFDGDHEDSFGIEIIKILAEQISGHIKFDNTRGASYTITFQ